MAVSYSVHYQTPFSHTFNADLFIKTAFNLKHIYDGSIEFTFVNDDFMISLHKSYLNDTSKTDIMTFNLNSLINPIGDIYICVNEADRNSHQYKTSLDYEIQFLILHGILHLIGYTDETDFEKNYMLDEQNRLLNLIHPLI